MGKLIKERWRDLAFGSNTRGTVRTSMTEHGQIQMRKNKLLTENEAQNRVAAGASAEEIAHNCYGIPFDKPAPSGQPDMTLDDGKTAEVKACKPNGEFKMELTAGGEGQ